MRLPLRLGPLVVSVFLLASCAAPSGPGLLSQVPRRQQAATSSDVSTTVQRSTAAAAVATSSSTTAATSSTTAVRSQTAVSASVTSRSATAATSAGSTAATASKADVQAVMAVIDKGNAEQQQAVARHDPTLMRDTATADYYAQLVQVAQDMENAGVAAIKLLKTEWGPVSIQGTSAQATTFETWQTAYTDGSTEQDRERNVYALVLQGGAWKVQADDHPDANLDQSSGSPGGNPAPSVPGVAPAVPGGPSTAPAPPARVAPAGPGESHNWSGYAATGGTFTSVSGAWTVPQVTPGGSFASDATWVSIGGVDTHDLIQAGTETNVLGSRTRYSAWVETLPQPSRTVPLTIGPGDTVSVSLAQQADGSWLIVMQNLTTGQKYQTTETYDSSRSSAEWVEEAPAGGRRVLPLDNFGTVQFKNGSTVENGKQETISQAGARPITMIDSYGQPIAKPSSLANDGSSFSVTREQDTAAPTQTAPGLTPPVPGTGGQGNGQPPFRRRPRGFGSAWSLQ